MCVQYRGGAQYRGMVFSSVGDITSTVGDILSTAGDVQYRREYHNNNNKLYSQLEPTRLSAQYKVYKIDDQLTRNQL